MTDPDKELYGRVGSRQAEYATAADTASAQDDEDSHPIAETRGAYKPCRKKPAEDQETKEEEEDVVVEKSSKKGSTRIIDGRLHWHDPKNEQWGTSRL
jgi:hypothetical protein